MTSCEDPYIGDESMSRPPSAKKTLMTSAQTSLAAGSLPTLNVIELPRPTSGRASPLEGMARVRIGPGPGRAARRVGRRAATKPVAPVAASEPRNARRESVGLRIGTSLSLPRTPGGDPSFLGSSRPAIGSPLLLLFRLRARSREPEIAGALLEPRRLLRIAGDAVAFLVRRGQLVAALAVPEVTAALVIRRGLGRIGRDDRRVEAAERVPAVAAQDREVPSVLQILRDAVARDVQPAQQRARASAILRGVRVVLV